MCLKLDDKVSIVQNYQNTHFDKSYGFHTGMQKHIEGPKRRLRLVVRHRKRKITKISILIKKKIYFSPKHEKVCREAPNDALGWLIAQNYQNTCFYKSYGFHTGMQKHIEKP